MAQKERENFYRNSTVIVDHGKESMSAIIDNDLSNRNMTFEDFINRHQHDIYHLCYNKFPCCQCPVGRFVPANKNRILYPGQLDILLDTSGSTLNGHNPNTSTTSQHCCRPAKKSLSTSNLDITLLRCLLMNFAQNCRTNSVLRQDVEDLVKCRNKMYGHAKEARLSDSDYSKYKTDVEGIILRIARFCNIENEMRQKLYDASQRPLDESILLQYTKTLIEQSVYEKNIVEKVDELQQQMTLKEERLHCRMDIMEGKVSEVGHRKRNIIAHTEARLLEHSKDDTYTVTEDVKSCCDILEKYKTLVIIAKAGGGKSKTCLQIATMFQDISFTPMLFVNDEISRNRDLINFDDKNIVIVEDLFGRSNIEFNEDLHTEAVRILEETYITKKCSLSDRGKCKRSKLSDIYVLQHNTVQEAILVSYGDDADVLPYCDLGFLYEYIRPKGYEDSLDEQMVFLFCDYKHIATKLISMLSTDDITFTIVGFYLKLVALLHRRDEIINFFFQNLEDVKPNEYACLVNGLTSFGKNPALVKFHPNLCKEILIHAGMTVFRAFCRPIGWTENDTNFVEIETDLFMKKIYFIIDTSRLKENCQELEENKGGVHYYFNLFESNGSRYNVGNYVFKNLIAKGFLNIVESLFEKLKQNAQKISPKHVKEFLDGLLDGGKRSSIISQFKEFFEAVLFKYCSIPTILQLCIPSTSTILNPNLIKVDDRLLTGKLSAYLESSFEMEFGLNTRLPAVSKEDGSYFVYYDNDYLKRKHINLMADYFLEHGFRSNNEKFVRMMHEQFVSEKEEKSVNDDPESSLDNGQNEDEVEHDWAAKYTKVVFDDYPGDEIWEDENGKIVHIRINTGFVKEVYREKNPIFYVDTTCVRLFLFLFDLKPYLRDVTITKSKRMAFLQMKFNSLYDYCRK